MFPRPTKDQRAVCPALTLLRLRWGLSACLVCTQLLLPPAGLRSGCQVAFPPPSLCPGGAVLSPAIRGFNHSLTQFKTVWAELSGRMH